MTNRRNFNFLFQARRANEAKVSVAQIRSPNGLQPLAAAAAAADDPAELGEAGDSEATMKSVPTPPPPNKNPPNRKAKQPSSSVQIYLTLCKM